MKNTAINVEGLKKALPHGAIKDIAERSKVSRYTVYSVLKGRGSNPRVLSTLKNYMQEVSSAIPEINNLVSEINNMVSPVES